MLMTEWNWDDAKEAWQEEAFEEGRKEERESILKLLNQGLSIEEIKQHLEYKS